MRILVSAYLISNTRIIVAEVLLDILIPVEITHVHEKSVIHILCKL